MHINAIGHLHLLLLGLSQSSFTYQEGSLPFLFQVSAQIWLQHWPFHIKQELPTLLTPHRHSVLLPHFVCLHGCHLSDILYIYLSIWLWSLPLLEASSRKAKSLLFRSLLHYQLPHSPGTPRDAEQVFCEWMNSISHKNVYMLWSSQLTPGNLSK